MYEEQNHIIHLAKGRLAPDSSTSGEDIHRIVARALESKSPSGIVLHFHGGLVSQKGARETARERLYPLYAQRSQAYPIFFVWESGFIEVVRNNLQEIVRESLFQQFVRKAAEWLLKSLPVGAGFKGGGGVLIDEDKLRRDFNDWFNGKRSTPPEQLEPVPGLGKAATRTATRSAVLNEQKLEDNITDSIEGDDDFRHAVQAVQNGLLPAGAERPTTRGGGPQVSENSLISEEASERLFERRKATTTKGFSPIAWWKIGKAVTAIVKRSLGRFKGGRDHGMYVTLVEETLRELYVDKLGRTIWWERMKQDTADAFHDGKVYGGTAFLYELKSQLQNVSTIPKIALIGHSAGAIFVCNFLKAAYHWLPQLQFDVIFEAPAVSHKILADAIHGQRSQIRCFRQFGMSDALESTDRLLPLIYISSLLYFVSGLLEEEPDEPLAGMERFLSDDEIYSDASFPDIAACRRFYARYPHSLIWSVSDAGDGRNCDSHRHGDFDDRDEQTMKSVQHILQHGY